MTMSEPRDVLERIADRAAMREPAFDRLHQRRDRKRRNQRLGAVAVALAVALLAFAFASSVYRTAQVRPANGTQISTDDLGRIGIAWTSKVYSRSGGITRTPLVVGDTIYLVTDHLYAFDAACRNDGGGCYPRSATGSYDVVPPPRQLGDLLVVGTDVYDLTCAAPPCAPIGSASWAGNGVVGTANLGSVASVSVSGQRLTAIGIDRGGQLESMFCAGDPQESVKCGVNWTANVDPPTPLASNEGCAIGLCVREPVVADGMIFVTSKSSSGQSSRLYAFSQDCPRTTGTSPASQGGYVTRTTCFPVWTAKGPSFGDPVVSDGVVYMVTDDRLSAFPEKCVGICHATWTTAPLGRFVDTLVVEDGTVYVASQGNGISAFPTSCGSTGATCTATWNARADTGAVRSPIVADGKVIVPTSGRLEVFPASCSATCRPLWTTAADPSVLPVVSDGVVYAGAIGRHVAAFPLDCRIDGGTCDPRWTGTTKGPIRTIAVGAGGIYVGTGDGTLYAFRLESDRRPAGSSADLIIAIALAATLAAGFFLGRRMRSEGRPAVGG
jgi:hypothetical protein